MPHLEPPVTVELPASTESLEPQAFFAAPDGKLEASEEFNTLILPATERLEPAPAYRFQSYAIVNEMTPEQLLSELPQNHTFSATEFFRIAAYVSEWGKTDYGVPRKGPLYDQDMLLFVRGVNDVTYPCILIWENSEDHHVLPTRSYWKIYIANNATSFSEYQVCVPISDATLRS